MYSNERHKIIIDHLSKVHTASTNQIQQLTGASIATVRRDLSEMEKAGLLQRAHGYVQISGASPIAAKDPKIAEDKEHIAAIAASQINDGDTLFLGSGTTCASLARHLRGKQNLTIMTINLDVVEELTKLKNVKLSILGGDVHVENGYIETLDEYTIQLLKRLYFEKVFVTVDGIDFKYGYSIRKQLQLSLFQHLLRNSKEFFCLADASKFNKRTYMQFCPIDAIHKIVTTDEVRDCFSEQFAMHGIEVICN